jgi:hypothetical protein
VRCEGCGAELPVRSRSDRRFCNATCRRRAHRRRERERALAARAAIQRAPATELEAALQVALDETRLVALIAQASRNNWRAAAWLLERSHPERWASGYRPVVEAEQRPSGDDPFHEVDQLAERRRHRQPD